MARKVHALGADESTECRIRLASFPRMRSTLDIPAVTCKGCLAAIQRRTEAALRSQERQPSQEPLQLDVMTKKDLKELKAFIEECLSELKVELRQPPARRYMNVDECAAYIGRSRSAVCRLVLERAIPYIRFDRKITFDREKIDRWIERRSMRVLSIRS